MPLKVIRNDITQIAADAIVNAANQQASVGTGVDAAIYNAAGYAELLRERQKLGEIAPGRCVPTSGFKLQCKYILHTIGMLWQGGEHGEEEVLRSCYRNALKCAAFLNCQSVAMPLLASGNFGYPKGMALRIAQEEINRFLVSHDMEIILTLYDEESVTVSKELFSKVEDYIGKNYIAPQKRFNEVLDPSLEVALNRKSEEFRDMLFSYMERHGLKPSDVYTAANIDRKTFSKLKKNVNYHPSKVMVLSLAIGLKLDLRMTHALLHAAGYALSDSSRFDIIIKYCITHKIYSNIKVNEILYDHGYYDGIGSKIKE